MDWTLLIALLAATVSLLLFGATLMLVAVLVAFVWRSRRNAARAAWRDAATPVPTSDRDATLAPTSAPPATLATPAVQNVGLIGFFDDESSGGPGSDEPKRAELFPPKRGTGWMDDYDEGEATEIFSAHSAAAELAEFAFDEADEATGRFSKSEVR